MGQTEKIIAGLEPPALEGLTRAPFPVDHWIVDVKSMDSAIYERYTGRPSGVSQNLSRLQKLVPNEKVTIKVPAIPDFNEDRDLDADMELIRQQFGFTDVVKTTYKVINR